MGSGREARGKENPRINYAAGFRTEPAMLASPRQLPTDHDMRFRPANIRVINRRNSRLDRDSRCLLRKLERTGKMNKRKTKESS